MRSLGKWTKRHRSFTKHFLKVYIIVISIPNERLIDALRRWTGGIRALWRTGGADEWHLHEFDMAYLRQKAVGHLEIQEVVPTIAGWMPLRYVVRCACLPVASDQERVHG